MSKMKNAPLVPITELLEDIIDNRGKSCPTQATGFPLIATNCIKHSSIYPTFENIRYVSDEVLRTWFRAELKPNDILFVNKGTPGRVCLVPEPITFCAAQDMIGLRANPNKVYYKYLFAILRSNYIQEKIRNFYVGIAIPHFKKSDMDNLLIPVPEMELQIKIGDIYCQLSEKAENNNKINLELESMAKTIYDYWFLQFEFPNKDGKPYKSSEGKMIWNEELKREIPEGWEVGRLNQFIKQDKGGDWGKEFPEGNYIEKVICLRGADFPAICGAAKLEAPDRFINKKNMFKTLKKGDLIIEISGGSPTQSTGRICYINTNVLNRFKNKLITSNFCKAINLIDEDFLYWFYNMWRKLYDSGVFFKYEGKTTGIKNLLFEMLCRDYPIIIPITDVIKKYNKKIEKLYDEIQQKLLENAELLSLRDFLLPLFMNGQVGFKD